MAKDRSLAGIDVRKSSKKRKDPPAPTATGSGTRLQLDDILAGIPTKAAKSTAGVQGKEERKKLKASESGNEVNAKAKAIKVLGAGLKGKGKAVSALDLLMGPSTSTRRSSTSVQPPSSSLSTAAAGNMVKPKKPTPKPSAADAAASTLATTSAFTTTEVAPIHTPQRSTPSLSPPPPPPPRDNPALSRTDLSLDVPLVLKTYKTSYRTLVGALTALEEEGRLLERVWYKNASQFKSALWWGSLDSVRRTLRSLLSRSAALRVLTLVYAALGAGEDGLVAQQARLDSLQPNEGQRGIGPSASASLPKLSARPTAEALRGWLGSTKARELLDEAVESVEKLLGGVRVVRDRCASTGKVLVRHLNTPPAPTFAPLVSALLALVANVDAQARALVAQPAEKAERGTEGDPENGPVNVLLRLLLDLRQT